MMKCQFNNRKIHKAIKKNKIIVNLFDNELNIIIIRSIVLRDIINIINEEF